MSCSASVFGRLPSFVLPSSATIDRLLVGDSCLMPEPVNSSDYPTRECEIYAL